MVNLSDSQRTEFFEKAEARLKQHMLQEGDAGRLVLRNFVPKTGIGKFDARYDPRGKRLDVTVNFAYDFHRDRSKPEQALWTPLEQIEFRNKAKPLIEEGWSGRYQIACAKRGWTDLYADVFVHFNEVAEEAAAYIVRVTRLRAFKSSGGIDHGEVPHVCGVNNFACEVDLTKSAANAFNYQEGLLRNYLRGLTGAGDGDFLPFAPGATELTPEVCSRLAKWITRSRPLLTEELAAVQAFVVGQRGKSDPLLARQLQSQRARAVAQFVNSRVKRDQGLEFAEVVDESSQLAKTAVAALRSRAQNNPRTGHGGVLVVVGTKQGAARALPQKYVVMLHEFGHMLGLPDEYMGVHDTFTQSLNGLDAVIPETYQASKISKEGNHARLEAMQRGMAEDLALAKVPAPNLMGTTGRADGLEAQQHAAASGAYDAKFDAAVQKHGRGTDALQAWKRRNPQPESPAAITTVSTSIMHSGHDINPCHYITLWSALAKLTAGYVDPDQWKIVPHPGKPSTIARFRAS